MTPTMYYHLDTQGTKTKPSQQGLLAVPVHPLQQEGDTVGAVDIVRQLAKPGEESVDFNS